MPVFKIEKAGLLFDRDSLDAPCLLSRVWIHRRGWLFPKMIVLQLLWDADVPDEWYRILVYDRKGRIAFVFSYNTFEDTRRILQAASKTKFKFYELSYYSPGGSKYWNALFPRWAIKPLVDLFAQEAAFWVPRNVTHRDGIFR